MPDGAGSHNSVYRGKNLGSAVTSEQYAAIKDGTFKDLFIGDYWEIGGVNWRIAAFDYFLNTGDSGKTCTKHHAVIVPDTALYTASMDSSASTGGGYGGSDMYKTGLNKAVGIINANFNGHILTHNKWIVNGVNGYGTPVGGFYTDRTVDLMNTFMVWGNKMYLRESQQDQPAPRYYMAKTQLPLFLYNPAMLVTSVSWWLSNSVSSYSYADMGMKGNADQTTCDNTGLGVRPYFLLYGGEA